MVYRSHFFRSRIVAIASLVACLPGALQAAPAASCPNDFRALIAGIRVQRGIPDWLTEFPQHRIEHLATGFNANAYLATPPRGKAFIVKDYIRDGTRTPEQAEKVRRSDILGFKALTQATSSQLDPKQLRPVAILQEIGVDKLTLEHAPGTTLQSLTARIDLPRKQRMQRLFRRQLESLRRKIAAHGRFQIDGQVFEVSTNELLPPGAGGYVQLKVILKNADPSGTPAELRLWIKPDNVVLTADGRFLIIDPH